MPRMRRQRLRKEALYVKIGGRNIHELMTMSIKDLTSFFDSLKLTAYEEKIAARASRRSGTASTISTM